MSAKDVFHEVVKIALQKDGWEITNDPLKWSQKFLERSSAISEFHTALGQFINYRGALKRLQPERVLYLAVPLTTYKTFFQLDFPKEMILENSVKMVIYDVEKEVIFQWIN